MSVEDYLNLVSQRLLRNTAADASRQLPTAGDRTPIPLVYGEDRLGGAVLNALPAGTDSLGVRYILIQVLWCHGPIHSVSEITFNDKPLAEATNLFHTYDGSQTAVSSLLVTPFADLGITYADTLEGYAYSLIWLPENKFTGVLNFAAIVKGMKVYDPRQDASRNLIRASEAIERRDAIGQAHSLRLSASMWRSRRMGRLTAEKAHRQHDDGVPLPRAADFRVAR
jgi:hypothetical protein